MRLCRQAASQAHLDAIETLIQMETNLKRSCSHCRGFKEGRPNSNPNPNSDPNPNPNPNLNANPHRSP